MNSVVEDKIRHTKNLTYFGVVIGIGIPVFDDIVFIFIPTLRAMLFEVFFVMYSVSIPLGFIIFLYSLFLRQKLKLMSGYWWVLALIWFLVAALLFLGTFNRG